MFVDHFARAFTHLDVKNSFLQTELLETTSCSSDPCNYSTSIKTMNEELDLVFDIKSDANCAAIYR